MIRGARSHSAGRRVQRCGPYVWPKQIAEKSASKAGRGFNPDLKETNTSGPLGLEVRAFFNVHEVMKSKNRTSGPKGHVCLSPQMSRLKPGPTCKNLFSAVCTRAPFREWWILFSKLRSQPVYAFVPPPTDEGAALVSSSRVGLKNWPCSGSRATLAKASRDLTPRRTVDPDIGLRPGVSAAELPGIPAKSSPSRYVAQSGLCGSRVRMR